MHAYISWRRCAELPFIMSRGKTTMINGKVYCGGGATTDIIYNEYLVCSYDPLRNTWITLPPLPVRCFGLGQLNGQLVAVGGIKKSDKMLTNEAYVYDEQSGRWLQTIPPMRHVRYSPSILSLESALVGAGGCTSSGMYTDAVEVFKPDTSEWVRD